VQELQRGRKERILEMRAFGALLAVMTAEWTVEGKRTEKEKKRKTGKEVNIEIKGNGVRKSL
jgi:hypothetical protein